MKHLLSLCALFAAVFASAAEPAAPVEVRVVSYNILGGDGTGGSGGPAGTGQNAWASRKDLVAEIFRSQKADLISVQKGGRVSLDDLHKPLPGYGEIGVARDDGKTAGEYVAILYKLDRFDLAESGTFWLSETPETAGSKGWGMRMARICTWARFIDKKSGAGFYLFNTHLDPTAAAARDNSAKLILEHIKARKVADPYILTGDMNSGEASSTIQVYKTTGGLVDTFRALHPSDTGVGTRHQFAGTVTGDKVDYILVPTGVTVTDSVIIRDQIDGKYPSDHFAVAATLRIPNSK